MDGSMEATQDGENPIMSRRIRSVNVFRSVDPHYPIRLEFWQDDELQQVREVKEISVSLAAAIGVFITEAE